jgi:hypothetical protein
MINAGAWDGIGSAVVGGLIGALTVALGAVLAYRLAERSRRADRREDDQRAADEERRVAAAQLMVTVSNVRDDVCSRRRGLSGSADLFPLRNALFTTHIPLHRYATFREVQVFYETVEYWRWWVRNRQPTEADPRPVDQRERVVDEYRAALWKYGDSIITLLQDHLTEDPLRYARPPLPSLPDSVKTTPQPGLGPRRYPG